MFKNVEMMDHHISALFLPLAVEEVVMDFFPLQTAMVLGKRCWMAFHSGHSCTSYVTNLSKASKSLKPDIRRAKKHSKLQNPSQT